MENTPDQCSTGAAFACGGPIFVPDLISPITSVFDFKSSLLGEISNLEAELDTSTADFDDELSVDEIKVFSEEELVEIALMEGFNDDLENADMSQNMETAEEVVDHPCISGKEIVCLEDSACQSDGLLQNKSTRNKKSEKNCGKKSGRVSEQENVCLEDSACHSDKSTGKKKSEKKKSKKRGRVSEKENVCLEDSACHSDSSLPDKPSRTNKSEKKKSKKRGRISEKEIVCLEDSVCHSDGSLPDKSSRTKKSEKKKSKKRGPASEKEIVCLEDSACQIDSSLSNKSTKRKKSEMKKSKRKGRLSDRESRAAQLEGDYLIRVKELAKLKQKQDEDKLQVRLHSFRGNSKSTENKCTTSEKNERMRSLRSITHPIKKKFVGSEKFVPFSNQPEVLLFVEIYHNRITSRKTQEFLVLGSQLLSELRDKIYCLTDELMQSAEEHVPSGYFLIEDTFCNDLRGPAVDYSLPIFEWLQNNREEAKKKWEFIMSGELKKMQKELLGNAVNLPSFKSVRMDKTRFCDLRFRLGAGYLYCHQGNCKHLMVIRDMRIVDPEDEQNQADYPLLTYKRRSRERVCSVCRIFLATKMTTDDEWAQKIPCYYCIKCYFLLHYKEDGSVLYPHSVYDYFND